MRPQQAFPRRDLAVVARRPPTQEEVTILGPGRIVVECQLGANGANGASGASGASGGPGGPGGAGGGAGAAGAGAVDLAMAESALTGLLVWLEAAPPGSHLDVAL
jgi:hypothetical protein